MGGRHGDRREGRNAWRRRHLPRANHGEKVRERREIKKGGGGKGSYTNVERNGREETKETRTERRQFRQEMIVVGEDEGRE